MSEHHDMTHGGEAAHSRSGHRGHDAVEHHSGGSGGHHAHMVADFRRRFWVSLILSIPVLALAPLIQAWLGLSERLAFPGDRPVQAVFATIIYLYGGWPFLRGVAGGLARRQPGLMTLVARATSRVGLQRAGRPRAARRGVLLGAGDA